MGRHERVRQGRALHLQEKGERRGRRDDTGAVLRHVPHGPALHPKRLGHHHVPTGARPRDHGRGHQGGQQRDRLRRRRPCRRGLHRRLLPRLRPLPPVRGELLRQGHAHLQRRLPGRQRHLRRLLKDARGAQALRGARSGHAPARRRGAAAVRGDHRVQPHEAPRHAAIRRGEPGRGRAGWTRPCRRQVRQGVRSPRHRRQHVAGEGEGGEGAAWRRRLRRQHRPEADAGHGEKPRLRHRHCLGEALVGTYPGAAQGERQARARRGAGPARRAAVVPAHLWEEDGEWEHDGRDEGDAGDAGPVWTARHHLRHRARLHRRDQRRAPAPRAQRRPLPLRHRHRRRRLVKLEALVSVDQFVAVLSSIYQHQWQWHGWWLMIALSSVRQYQQYDQWYITGSDRRVSM